jgi:hypothetical protein
MRDAGLRSARKAGLASETDALQFRGLLLVVAEVADLGGPGILTHAGAAVGDTRLQPRYGDGAGTGTTILFGGGGGCVRQSINFHTATTTRITAAVAIHKRAALSLPPFTYC